MPILLADTVTLSRDELRSALRRRVSGRPDWHAGASQVSGTSPARLLARLLEHSFQGGLSSRNHDHLDVLVSSRLLKHPDGREWICHLAVDRVGRAGTLTAPKPEFVTLVAWRRDAGEIVREIARSTHADEHADLEPRLLSDLTARVRVKLTLEGYQARGSNPLQLRIEHVIDAVRRRAT